MLLFSGHGTARNQVSGRTGDLRNRRDARISREEIGISLFSGRMSTVGVHDERPARSECTTGPVVADGRITRAVADAVPIPVIASGGVGTLSHLADGVRAGHADAVLAASIFHYGEYTVGQAKVREQLEIFMGAARQRGEALDHVLLFGPPGLGKTTLSHIIAHELGVNLRQTSGPVLEKPKDLAALLTGLDKNDVLFIDEIHRLSPVVEEILYPALEDYQIDIMIGEGPAARSIKLDLQPFTLVGATTRAGMLTNPLRDRFGIVSRLEFYSPQELTLIVRRSAGLLNVEADEDSPPAAGTAVIELSPIDQPPLFIEQIEVRGARRLIRLPVIR